MEKKKGMPFLSCARNFPDSPWAVLRYHTDDPMMISTDAGHFKNKSFGRVLLAGILCLSSSILACHLWGFKYGIINNEYHTIIVDKISMGIRFPGDAFAVSMENYFSPFWYIVAQCTKIFPTPIVFLTFYAVAWVLLNAGVSSLIAALTVKKNWIFPWVLGSYATLSVGFIMNLPLGFDPVIAPYLSQTFLSVGLCLLSFSLTLEKHYSWSAAVLGVAYNINAMQTNFMLGILVVIWFISCRAEGKTNYYLFLKYFVIFMILASPTLIWIITVIMKPPAVDFLSGWALYDYAKFYFPFHYFLSVKLPLQIIDGIAISVIPLLITVYNKYLGGNKIRVACEKELLIASIISSGYLIAGIFFSYYIPSRFILGLHFFRSDAIVFPITASILLAIFINNVTNDKDLLPIYIAVPIFFLNHYISVSFLIILLLLTVRYIKGRHYNESIAVRNSLQHLTLTSISIVLLILYMAIFFFNHKKQHDLYWRQFDYKNAEIDRVAQSVSEIVPRDALFVIPPIYYIRSHLHRGVYLSMHDGGAYLFKKGFEIEFLRRLQVLGIRYTPGISRNDETVTKEFQENIHPALLRLKTEGVTHAILPSSTIKNFPSSSIFQTENFIVLDIDNAILATSPLSYSTAR